MKLEKEIYIDDYLSNITQKSYYQQKRKELESIKDENDYSDFEIDLYNMGIV